MNVRLLLIVLIFAAALICGYASANEDNSASISGFVYDASNGEAIIGANVYIPELAVGGSTNLSGYYFVSQVSAGSYEVVCEMIGYRLFKQTVNLKSGENVVIDVRLPLDVVEGQSVDVVADSVRTSIRLYEKPISNIELSPRQINAIPQVAEGDLLRSLQTLPGVQAVSDFSSALYVRGGTPDQNLYLIDGTDVYNPEHAFGIFSTFNTDAIKHVEISKGGFNASYGGRLSSILDVINLDGNRNEFQGSASVSLLSAKTTLQMPLGEKGAISGSIRRTYFDKTVAKLNDDLPEYYFYDGNLKAFYELSPSHKLTLSGYGGSDVLKVTLNPNATVRSGFDLNWGNQTGSARLTSVFTPRLFGNFWLTGSRFSSTFDVTSILPAKAKNFISDVSLKGNLEYHHSAAWLVRFGFEQKNLHVIYKEEFPGGEVDIDQRPKHYTGYLQNSWRPSTRWDIEAGIRYNYFTSDKDFQSWEPRASLKYRLTNTVNLKAAVGRYHQFLNRIPQTVASDIWSTANQYQDKSEADHFILGYQQEVARNYEFEIEGYFKRYRNIYQFNQTFLTELQNSGFNENGDPIFSDTQGIFNGGDGQSSGAELLFRKNSGAINGWIGYSYTRTRYEFGTLNAGEEFAPRHDRHSTVNIVSNIDIPNAIRKLRGKSSNGKPGRWVFGLNGVYSSGQPITQPGSAYLTGELPGTGSIDLAYFPAAINSVRLPHYARLDVSLTYKKKFTNWALDSYIQVFNVGNRKNIWFVEYDYSQGIPEIETVNMFPILPTIGFRLQF
ncbi:MAG: TonB-dependent receptor [Calditrichia bacterium]